MELVGVVFLIIGILMTAKGTEGGLVFIVLAVLFWTLGVDDGEE